NMPSAAESSPPAGVGEGGLDATGVAGTGVANIGGGGNVASALNRGDTGAAMTTFAAATGGAEIGCAMGGFGVAGLLGAAPLPCMRKPHLGHKSCAADCSSAWLKLCAQTGFGQGIVFAMAVRYLGMKVLMRGHHLFLLSAATTRTQEARPPCSRRIG